ncbi:MAG: dihydroneopterin aldolase [Actinobacteria bacterium]|uniref:dihydroneopterin aldolase n=1 Tax=freshwater metagenome TaxID=449393 RepID=A0A6J6NUX3_9ZZZZ|nr:dihydroneopterin aldolase [Actinomycetota bacterium]
MIVELQGLELWGYHGVLAEEKRDGQPFLFDIQLDVGEHGADDNIDNAVDYRDVVRTIKELSDSRSFDLLEALAPAIADTLLARFPISWVKVRVRKPTVRPAGEKVDWSAVTVERKRT